MIMIDHLSSTTFEAWKDAILTGKKIRVKWSQTRGGFAIFVGNRMEGEIFNNETEAWKWLEIFGVEKS